MNSTYQRPRRSHLGSLAGFTIIELILVLTVAGVMATISIGAISKQNTHTRVQKAASAVEQNLQFAFALAGRSRKPVQIKWVSSALQLQIRDRAGTVYRRVGFSGNSGFNLTSSNISFSRATDPLLEIMPSGYATDTLNILFSSNGFSRRVRMTRGGIIQSYTP
ncbi:MAG: hypothetical protein JWO05_2463 [Gemmatimonadetes bacterium]|nr:hypothetical protein [Gemmatimonadota bacterium]